MGLFRPRFAALEAVIAPVSCQFRAKFGGRWFRPRPNTTASKADANAAAGGCDGTFSERCDSAQLRPVMKIDRTPTPTGPAPARKSEARRAGDGAFAAQFDKSPSTDGADGAAAAGVAAAGAIGSIDALLALQGADDAASGMGANARARAEEILQKLDEVRMRILSGDLSNQDLNALRQAVDQQRGDAPDPRAAEILDEIDLRAQVELAKRGL